MQLDKIPPGENPPYDINVIIEIPGGAGGGSPVKYEIDKDSGALFVDRIVNVPMFYPNNYGFVPNTLHEDGDPVDVMVRTEDKLIAMPIEKVDPFQAEIQDLQDLPSRHRERIWHFFEHYKALEEGKWAKISGWGDKAEAQRLLMASIERY